MPLLGNGGFHLGPRCTLSFLGLPGTHPGKATPRGCCGTHALWPSDRENARHHTWAAPACLRGQRAQLTLLCSPGWNSKVLVQGFPKYQAGAPVASRRELGRPQHQDVPLGSLFLPSVPQGGTALGVRPPRAQEAAEAEAGRSSHLAVPCRRVNLTAMPSPPGCSPEADCTAEDKGRGE